MNLFDKTVQSVLQNNRQYSSLRPVIEKEILHYDILHELNDSGILKDLTFIGGTCLRSCYGSQRLSEDLDFTGGFDFNKDNLASFPKLLKQRILKKYGFAADVSIPQKESGNVSTWKIKIITRPKQKDLPAQRINLDIAMLPSYQRQPMMLKNSYFLEAGISGLILQAESLEEIMADKLIAFACRQNRVKNRDLWDIFYLSRKNIVSDRELIKQKLSDRKIRHEDFSIKYNARLEEIKSGHKDFLYEMRRFLPPSAFDSVFMSENWWNYLCVLLKDFAKTCGLQ